MTIIALDLGTKNVGVAISHGIITEGWKTIPYSPAKEAEFMQNLRTMVSEQKVEKIVIGLPLGSDGKPTKQSIWTESLGDKISAGLGIPVEYSEESFSSHNESGRHPDHEAARIILEQYLNETKHSSI